MLRSVVRTNLFRKLKKGKEISASFAVAPQTADVMATVHVECLVEMKKTLNCTVTYFERSHYHKFY